MLELTEADHEESSPNAPMKLINKLSCSLVGQTRKIKIVSGSQAHRVYGKDETTEIFACNYGLNETYAPRLQSRDLRFSGHDEEGIPRMAELPSHPFYISTLFVPQMLSEQGRPHPLISAFLQSAV